MAIEVMGSDGFGNSISERDHKLYCATGKQHQLTPEKAKDLLSGLESLHQDTPSLNGEATLDQIGQLCPSPAIAQQSTPPERDGRFS